MSRIVAILFLLATGCGQSIVPQLFGTNTPAEIVSDASSYTLEAQTLPNNIVTPAKFSIAPGKGMVALTWSATASNVSAVVSERMVIDCLDKDGKILARDDVACVVKPGEQVVKNGVMDVPEREIGNIRRVVVGLVATAQ